MGDVVRGHERRRASAPRTSSPAASTTPATRTRASGSSPARAVAWAGEPSGPVAEHPHRPGRRESVRGRRLGGRSDQARSVGDLAGDGANAPGLGKDQIFVEKPIGPGIANCDGVEPAAADAGRRSASAGSAGSRWASSASAADPIAERRSYARRDRARHRVHRPERLGAVGGLVRDGHAATLGCTTTRWCSRPRPQRRARRHRRRGPLTWLNWTAWAARLRASSMTQPRRLLRPSVANENACSLNANPAADAEDPRVAAGTMNPATRPCRGRSGTRGRRRQQVFVSRLVGAARPRISRWSTAARRSRTDPTARLGRTSRSRATRPT